MTMSTMLKRRVLEGRHPPSERHAEKVNRSRHYIREWRIARGYSFDVFANLMWSTPARVRQIENNEANLTLRILERAARALQVEVGWLLFNPSVEADLVALNEKIRQQKGASRLSKDQQTSS